MTINAGVWIDHHKAVILLITDEGEDMRQIVSNDNQTAPAARKVESYLDKYYDEVIACLQNADSIWILENSRKNKKYKREK